MLIGCFALGSGAAAAAEKTLLVYGDSLSAAYGIEINQGWVYLLQQKMQQTNPNWKVVNVSISGETTAGGLSRLKTTLDKYKPDLMLLELGANDGLRGTSLKSTKQNLEKMIAMAQANKVRTVLFEMQIPPNYGPLYTRKFTNIFQELGKTYNLTVVPFFLAGVAGNSDLNQPDGIHPTAEAQPKLLENVWTGLQPLLE
ncbi:arylesterase [Endozoicomonas sp. 2B-B]